MLLIFPKLLLLLYFKQKTTSYESPIVTAAIPIKPPFLTLGLLFFVNIILNF